MCGQLEPDPPSCGALCRRVLRALTALRSLGHPGRGGKGGCQGATWSLCSVEGGACGLHPLPATLGSHPWEYERKVSSPGAPPSPAGQSISCCVTLAKALCLSGLWLPLTRSKCWTAPGVSRHFPSARDGGIRGVTERLCLHNSVLLLRRGSSRRHCGTNARGCVPEKLTEAGGGGGALPSGL